MYLFELVADHFLNIRVALHARYDARVLSLGIQITDVLAVSRHGICRICRAVGMGWWSAVLLQIFFWRQLIQKNQLFETVCITCIS